MADDVAVAKAQRVSFVELLDKLQNYEYGKYAFRGVKLSSYTLTPSALRPSENGDHTPTEDYVLTLAKRDRVDLPSLTDGKHTASYCHTCRELGLLYYFYRYTNQQGLGLPSIEVFNSTVDANRLMQTVALWEQENESIMSLTRWAEYSEDGKKVPIQPDEHEKEWLKYWYSPELEGIAALAQHYGLPTRLLDWTYDYYTALYFAIIGACERIKNDQDSKKFTRDQFSVYVLQLERIHTLPGDLRIVTPAYYTNPNLSAQKGLFTYWRSLIGSDELVEEAEGQISLDRSYHPYVEKFDIRYSELLSALEHIIDRGCLGSKYYPGYDGIKKEIEERRMVTAVAEKFYSSTIA